MALIWGMTTWHPRFRFSPRHARDLLGFSVSVFAANLAGFLNRRADALLIGVFFGPVAVGVYRIADRVVDVVLDVTMRPIGLVALPVLSRLQTDPDGAPRDDREAAADDDARDRSRAGGDLRVQRRGARRARRVLGAGERTRSSCSASSGSGRRSASTPAPCSSRLRVRASAR